jgi:hypothetical protein
MSRGSKKAERVRVDGREPRGKSAAIAILALLAPDAQSSAYGRAEINHTE